MQRAEEMLTPEEKQGVRAGKIVTLPRITGCPLSDGRTMNCGETWSYNDGPAHQLIRVEGRPQRDGVDQPGEPFPEFVTGQQGYGRLGFDVAQSGDPKKWVRIA